MRKKIKQVLDEDRTLMKIAKGRLKELKSGKSKLISHKEAWKGIEKKTKRRDLSFKHKRNIKSV